MKLFCKHNWELLTSNKSESIFERKRRLFKGTGGTFEYFNEEFKEALIQIFQCKNCGKIKKFKDYI